jgi:hypothetical protein
MMVISFNIVGIIIRMLFLYDDARPSESRRQTKRRLVVIGVVVPIEPIGRGDRRDPGVIGNSKMREGTPRWIISSGRKYMGLRRLGWESGI